MTACARSAGFAAAIAAIAAITACKHAAPEQIATSDKVTVVTRPATRGTVRAVVTATGTVKPAPGAELTVTAPQAARIAEMPKAVGDRVRKGELLVRFEIPSLRADVTGRTSEVARAEARLANARAAETRLRGLFERGVAARKELEDARRELADATASLAEAQGSRSAAGALAGREVVRAPFDGVVAARGHNPGDLVDTSTADPILRLIDPLRLQVDAAVPAAAATEIAVGSPARVFGPGAAAPEPATVLTRPAAIDPATGAAVVRLAFKQPAALPAGTPVRVEIQGTEHRNVVLVPAAALVQEGTDNFVYAVDAQGRAHRRPVAVGVAAGGLVEILSGVAPGEQVIVEGQNGLPDGAEVTVAPPALGAPGAGAEAPPAPATAPHAAP